MNIRWILSSVIIAAGMTWAQAAAGQSSGGGGQGGGGSALSMGTNAIGSNGLEGGTGTTAEGSLLSGKAAFAQGLGQYNYNTALATRHLLEANKQAIDNQLYAEKVYFEMRRLNDEYWLSKNPRLTPEQRVLIEQSRVPRRLTSSELDPVWGVIRWPAVLERPEFDTIREELNDVFAHRSE